MINLYKKTNREHNLEFLEIAQHYQDFSWLWNKIKMKYERYDKDDC